MEPIVLFQHFVLVLALFLLALMFAVITRVMCHDIVARIPT